jgi:hypothetical protein
MIKYTTLSLKKETLNELNKRKIIPDERLDSLMRRLIMIHDEYSKLVNKK